MPPQRTFWPLLVIILCIEFAWIPFYTRYNAVTLSSIKLGINLTIAYFFVRWIRHRLLSRRAYAQSRRYKLCPTCEYDLLPANPPSTTKLSCPECGHTFPRKSVTTYWMKRLHAYRFLKRHGTFPSSKYQ
jgi:predicted RNA-binding Zn-ribbon protein involved in translation (DUF1610 family)